MPTQYVPADRVKTLMPTFLQNHIKMNRDQNAVVLCPEQRDREVPQ